MPSSIFLVEGESLLAKSYISLDHPDVESNQPPNSLKSGDFGAARKGVAEATGAEKNNMEITWYGVYKMPGVVNEAGTEIHIWEDVSKAVDVIRWLTPEKVEELKEARDDVNAPRWVRSSTNGKARLMPVQARCTYL